MTKAERILLRVINNSELWVSKIERCEDAIDKTDLRLFYKAMKIHTDEQVKKALEEVEKSLMSDEEVWPDNKDDDFMEGWREGADEQRNRTQETINKLKKP